MKSSLTCRDQVRCHSHCHYHYINYTSLHFAVGRGFLDIVSVLLQHSANINAAGNDGMTPLYLAVSIRNLDVTVEVDDPHDFDTASRASLHTNRSGGRASVCNTLKKYFFPK